MLFSYLRLTLRNFSKNKLFVFINVLGMGIALACCITAFLNWDYNAKFDAYHADAENVYRVNFVRITNGKPVNNGSSPLPIGEQIKTTIPQAEKVVRYSPFGGNFKIENELFNTWCSFVDPTFFEVFNFPMVVGDAEQLKDKSSIFISTELQAKYFPNNANPVGQPLTYIRDGVEREFKVAGVFEKPPQNTSFGEGAFINYENIYDINETKKGNWSDFTTTFVRLNNASDVSEVERQLQAYVEVQNKVKEDYKVNEYYLDPFYGMAVRAQKENTWNHWTRGSLPIAAAFGPVFMSLMLLLLACFNFTNTSIAIANRRIKEIGIRKVLGSDRKQLIFQFLGENLLLVSLAMLAGLAIAYYLVPAYSAMWPFLTIELNLAKDIGLLGFLGLLLLFTAIVAGSYPAFYVSSFHPTTIFRGSVKFSGTNPLTRILLTLQFSISLMAIISGFVFSENAVYQEEYDMGFDMESVVFARVNDEQGYNQMRNALLGYDKIKEMAGSRHSISASWYTDPIKNESSELDVSIFDIGTGYLSTIGATIVEGRDFIADSEVDVNESVIINEELARTMGWENPIGKRITLKDTIQLNVIGMVKDIYFRGGLWNPLDPMLLRYTNQENYRFISIRADNEDLAEIKNLMDEKWKAIFPNSLSTVGFMDDEKANMSMVNNNIKVLFVFLGVVAVILSIIGLFSLLSLNLLKRMKEIGVRKVLGATIQNITLRVSREFIIILAIASVLGAIGGYYSTEMLMSSIWTYHVPMRPLPFILSIALLLITSGLVIGGKVYKAASVNPAEVLQSE